MYQYVLHHLPQLQNMHKYRVDADTKIEAFVQRHGKYQRLKGPPSVPYVHFFSKNLNLLGGYLETLVAFCPYYKADDGLMAGKMETFYQQAIHRYKGFTDKQLHQNITRTRKLTAWWPQLVPTTQAVFNGVGG